MCLLDVKFRMNTLGMDTYRNNLKRWNLAFWCQPVSEKSHINDVLQIEQSVFPAFMQDSLEDLNAFFADEYAHGLVLRQGNRPVGVLKGQHLDDRNTPQELLDGPDLNAIRDVTFYMDSVGILKESRSNQVLDFLMHEMAVDMRRFDYQYVAAHARVKGGLSRLYQRRYKAKVIARYDDWQNFGEAFDYILVDLKNVPIQPLWKHSCLRFMRRITRCF